MLEPLVNPPETLEGNPLSPKITLQNKIGYPFQNVVVDSRIAGSGDLYIALPGARVDGHDFVQDAASRGCVAAIVSRKVNVDIPQIVVSDPLDFLHATISEYIAHNKPQVIAITGSVGKTTTKEFLRQILSCCFSVAATPGNANSQIGLPLAIFNHFQGDEDFWVLEMGMTHPGQITQLCRMIPPDIALITHVAHVHAANFNTLEQIALAKAEIFSQPQTKMGFINGHSGCLTTLLNVGKCNKVVVDDEKVRRRYPHLFPGKHLYQNLALAIETALYLGILWGDLDRVVPTLTLAANRMELLELAGVTILNDSYNASEISTLAALDSLPTKIQGKKIALIGQMLELGQFSNQAHKNVANHALNKVDLMICYGEACKPIFEVWKAAGKPVFWTTDRSELLGHLHASLAPGDYLLLKGSRSNLLSELIPELRATL